MQARSSPGWQPNSPCPHTLSRHCSCLVRFQRQTQSVVAPVLKHFQLIWGSQPRSTCAALQLSPAWAAASLPMLTILWLLSAWHGGRLECSLDVWKSWYSYHVPCVHSFHEKVRGSTQYIPASHQNRHRQLAQPTARAAVMPHSVQCAKLVHVLTYTTISTPGIMLDCPVI